MQAGIDDFFANFCFVIVDRIVQVSSSLRSKIRTIRVSFCLLRHSLLIILFLKFFLPHLLFAVSFLELIPLVLEFIEHVIRVLETFIKFLGFGAELLSQFIFQIVF